jgi:hypothetical protein
LLAAFPLKSSNQLPDNAGYIPGSSDEKLCKK